MIEILQHDALPWIAISFALLVLLGIKMGAGKIAAALDKRIAEIRAEIDTAERLKKEAADLLADFQKKQQEAEASAEKIIADAKASALSVQKAAEAELSENMARREAQLAERLKRIEEKAIADIQNHAADLAMQATREIVVKTMDDKASGNLIDQAIKSASKYLQ